MVGHGTHVWVEWRRNGSKRSLQLGNRRKGSTAAGPERERVALWMSGYLCVLCCKLVRVRMHHGPMGRSMDDGDGGGWEGGRMMDGWVNERMG